MYVLRHPCLAVAECGLVFAQGDARAAHALILALTLVLLFVYDAASLKGDPWETVARLNAPARYVLYALLLSVIILFQAPGENAFVYFQF